MEICEPQIFLEKSEQMSALSDFSDLDFYIQCVLTNISYQAYGQHGLYIHECQDVK